jgi:tRNA1Val (adenine37-N6)-methyltransferase
MIEKTAAGAGARARPRKIRKRTDDAMNGNKSPAANETLDSLFEGRITLYQSRAGYRFSLDAVLLAHFVDVKRGDKIVDLGAGNGAIALMLAFLHRSARITAVEIQPAMIARARRNIALNGFAGRIDICQGDVRAISALPEPGSFDAAVCNPPYRSPHSGRVSPDPEKRIARHEFKGALEHFLHAGNVMLSRRGRMALVYPAFRCVDVLACMRAAAVEPKRLRMVHSSTASEASLLLVEGVKSGKSELSVEPPLIIYQEPRRYNAEVAAMLRGDTPDTA